MITDSLGLVALAMGAGAGSNPTLARTCNIYPALIPTKRTAKAASRAVLRASVNPVQGRAASAEHRGPGRTAISHRRGLGLSDASVSADHSLPVRMAGQALSKVSNSHPHKICSI